MLRPFHWHLKLHPARFAPRLEHAFQEDYYIVSRQGLLVTAIVLILLFLSLAYREIVMLDRSVANVAGYIGPMLALFVCVAGMTLRPMIRGWQAMLTAAASLAVSGSLLALASDLRLGHGSVKPTVGAATSIFTVYFFMFVLSAALFRFQFVHAAILNIAALLSGVYCVANRLPTDPVATLSFVQTSLLVVFTLVLAAFFQEFLARRAFLAHHLLQWERNDEVRRRERTEGMLNVLGRAIGVIVHDLGSPLTTVQAGAQTLRILIDGGETDKATLAGFTRMIEDSAELLNYLRLSLIEQTRVIEGKPTPLDLTTASLHGILEASTRFQKPGLAARRKVAIDCPAGEIRADAMKMITVFMNIIGNSLKYSDGEVGVRGRFDGGGVIVAVLDQGTAGIGINEGQARQLFVAFGRLAIHSNTQGTGLGLVSVQKIVEAHGGEVFIEGYVDGTSRSAHFSTARKSVQSMLEPPFVTAFVVTLPHLPNTLAAP